MNGLSLDFIFSLLSVIIVSMPMGGVSRGGSTGSLLLFGEAADAYSTKTAYCIYGIVTPIALAVIVLGAFTLVNRGPLAALLKARVYRLTLGGGLIGTAALVLILVIRRYHKAIGIDSLHRLEEQLPKRLIVQGADGTSQTRLLTQDGTRQCCLERLGEGEGFSLDGRQCYIRVTGDWYYESSIDVPTFDVADGQIVRDPSTDGEFIMQPSAALLQRSPGAVPRRNLIDRTTLLERLQPGEAVKFAGEYVNLYRGGIYLCSSHRDNTRLVSLSDLLDRDRVLPVVDYRPVDFVRDILPRLDDGENCYIDKKRYYHVCGGFYYEGLVDGVVTSVSRILSRMPSERMPGGQEIADEAIALRLNPEERVWFKGKLYKKAERSLMVVEEGGSGRRVPLNEVLRRPLPGAVATAPLPRGPTLHEPDTGSESSESQVEEEDIGSQSGESDYQDALDTPPPTVDAEPLVA